MKIKEIIALLLFFWLFPGIINHIKELLNLETDQKEKPYTSVVEVGCAEQQKHIKDMKDQEEAYCVPWAYNFESKELNLNHSITSDPFGTSCMPIKRMRNQIFVNTDFDYFGKKYQW